MDELQRAIIGRIVIRDLSVQRRTVQLERLIDIQMAALANYEASLRIVALEAAPEPQRQSLSPPRGTIPHEIDAFAHEIHQARWADELIAAPIAMPVEVEEIHPL